MMNFLRALPETASSPLAFVAYLMTLLAWTAIILHTKRIRTILNNIEKIPEDQRKALLEAEMNMKVPARISPTEWLKARRQKYFFLGMVILLSTFLAILAMAVYASRMPSTSKVIESIQDEALLNRIYSSSIDYVLVSAQFENIAPDEVALLVLGQDVPPFRLEFDRVGITASMEGYRRYAAPLSTVVQKVSQESGFYAYTVDLTYLRRIDPMHPLSLMTPRNFENVPVHLLVKQSTLDRIAGSEGKDLFSISVFAEASGYTVDLVSQNVRSENITSAMPRPVPGKPGYVMILPAWKTSLKAKRSALSHDKSSEQLSIRDVAKTVDYLDREVQIKQWRGIWPDNETLLFFGSTHKVPVSEESIEFHPWNYRFVRLHKKFESSGCGVPGISAFQIPDAGFFYLFARVNCEGKGPARFSYSKEGATLVLSLNELVTIHNILRELLILNKTVVELEGNYIEGLAILLPEHKKYIFLSSKLYHQYFLAHPQQQSSSPEEFGKASVLGSITLIRNLPK